MQNAVFTRIYLLIFLISCSIMLEAQVLLKNDDALIPLKHLEAFGFHLSGASGDHLNTAQEIASFYKEEGSSIRGKELANQINLFLIGNDRDLINARLQAADQNVLLFIGTPPIDESWADAIIYLEDSSRVDIAMAIQGVFGGANFEKKLEGDIGGFRTGAGVLTDRIVRLSFPYGAEGAKYKPLRDTLEAMMRQGLDSMAFPGAQLLVLHKGKVAVMENYGCHKYEDCAPVKSTDLYDMASITKVTTATPALMYLYEHGQLDLDGDLCSLFPMLCKSDKSNLSLREVLAHQARLQAYIVYWESTLRKNGSFKGRTFRSTRSEKYPIEIDEDHFLHYKFKRKIDKAIRKSPLNPEPGYVYSGLTFLLYPELIKERTGERIDSFMYSHFYDRLGANRLTYRPTDRFPLDEIVPTEVDTAFRKKLVHGYVHDEAAAMLDGLSTNAGLFANALDLGKYCQMLLNGGSYGGEDYLSPSTVAEFTRYQFADQGNRRGLGFDKPPLGENTSYVAQSASPESFGHTGFTGTFFWIDPTYDMVFIFFTNRVYPTRASNQIYRLNMRPSMHQAIYDFLDDMD